MTEQPAPHRVHTTVPPAAGATGPLYLDRVAHRAYPGDCDFLRAPHHRADIGTYLTDLLRPYAVDLDEDRLAAGAGQSYGEMAADLIDAVVAAGDPVDVLVVAFAVPDVRPGRATATYLSHVCPGNPHAFAVCDQGTAAAYTGLLLVREYLGSGAGQRGLLLVLEQATLHYAPPGAAPVPAGHTGVALLCGRRPPAPGGAAPGAARLDSVRVRADVAPERVREALADEVTGGPLIAGVGVDPADLPGRDDAVRADAGRPYTGVWWELSAALAGDGGGRLALVDYDPALRYLCTAVVERAGSGPYWGVACEAM